MTGYGEGTGQALGTTITVQLRSLNHRHLDLQVRSPREYFSFEEDIRKTIRETVSRGRIEAFVGRTPSKQQVRKVELNEELLGQYVRVMQHAKKRFGLAGQVDVSLLANFSDLIRVREVEAEPAEERGGLFKALRTALRKLEVSRKREGLQMKRDMVSQLGHLKKVSLGLESEAARAGLQLQRAAAVPKTPSQPVRNEKEEGELGNWVLKGDVNEEIVRLKSHITALAGVIHEREAVGKKIEFMLQEIQRELNTISSKVPQLPVVRLVLEGKERVEKIREQVQNIE
jgi:uncharacterized protein (TIGR00255 family)